MVNKGVVAQDYEQVSEMTIVEDGACSTATEMAGGVPARSYKKMQVCCMHRMYVDG